ncbi:LysR family transcriptional regulator [Thermocatellispora tengchongensis]|uniref:LysR family transcriptional regulator n=1 Tax=Thermocatellispora tengchongensis TaxID=1073253 RepID=UPI0036267800
MDTRALKYFIAVAEELSFSRAAARLYVSQPSLSRQIQRLENDLRTPLFQRTSRDVRLTPAGQALLPAAKDLIEQWTDAFRQARVTAAAHDRVLRIGFQATGAGKLGTRARALFEERHPGVSVEPRSFDWAGEVAALREGLVDVAYVWLPADTRGLTCTVIATEPRVLGLHSGHPLASRKSLTIMEIADVPLVWTRKAPRFWVDWWAVNPRPDGSEPRWGPENDNPEEQLEHVAAGVAGAIAPRSMAWYYARPDITWVPLTDVEPLRIALAWPERGASDLVPPSPPSSAN